MMSLQSRHAPALVLSFVGLVGVLGLVGCGDNQYAPPPPPPVTIAKPLVADVTEVVEYTGTTRAVEFVEVRARVEGFLQSMHFNPGQSVEKGDLLFIIDPEPFELALQAATARVASLKAELDLAQTEFERTRVLYEKAATSEIIYIKARAKRDSAAADLSLATADQRTAELDLEYAHVRAPLAGRVGRHEVDIGNLVGSDGATLLTSIVVYSPIYVFFHISERDLFSLQESSAERREELGREWEERDPNALYVGKAGEDGFPHTGIVDFTANQIDAGTGTYEIRGLLVNRGHIDEIIIPGSFVRVQIPLGEDEDALLVPERALAADQNGRFVLIVNADNVVEQRGVAVGPTRRDGYRVIEKGLTANDSVIIKGLQRARPGATVDPTKEDLQPIPAQETRPRPQWPEGRRPTDGLGADAREQTDATEPPGPTATPVSEP